VIVDLAVERGGNCALAQAGMVVQSDNGVKIIGYLNMAGRLPATASLLYAKNLFTFVEILIDKDTHALAFNEGDDIIAATMLTHGGHVVHPRFQPQA